MKKDVKLETEVRNLLTSQKFAVLSTQEPNNPYVSLVAFAVTTDLRTIVFATTRATRKYVNMMSRSGVALLVDNRSNDAVAVRNAIAVTIIGSACEAPETEREELDRVYFEKHPNMKDFLYSSSTALIKVQVESYLLVSRFQNVTVLHLK